MVKADIETYLLAWREQHGVTGDGPLSEAQTVELARGLREVVSQLPVHPERAPNAPEGKFAAWDADAAVIPYSGAVDGVPAWKLARSMSENGEGRVFYISDTPAGQFIDDRTTRALVAEVIGGADEQRGKDLAGRIYDGTWDEHGVRSKLGVGDVPALNDVVSEQLMSMAHGDVRSMTSGAEQDRVFVQTELPALLSNEHVTAINGIPKETLLAIHQETGSYVEVNQAVAEASRALMDKTRYTLSADGAAASERDVSVTAIDGSGLFAGSGVAGPAFTPGAAQVETLHAPPMARLTVSSMDGAAFEDLGPKAELSSILADTAQKLRDGATPPFAVQDTNGNDVGQFEIVASAQPGAPKAGSARLEFDLSTPAFQHDRNGQLAQGLMAASDQLAAPGANNHIVIATPAGQEIGKLDITPPPPPPPAPAPVASKEAASLSM